VGDCSEINWTRELSSRERDELRAFIEQKEELLNTIGKVRTVMGDEDADASTKKELEKEYRALADQYTEVDEQGKQYFRESRRASFVWMYLRSKSVNQDLQASASATESGTTVTRQPAAEVEDAHDDGPVTIGASVQRMPSDEGSRFQLAVNIDIAPGWHIYASAAEGSPFRPIQLDLDLPDNVRPIGEWQRPRGAPYIDDPTMQIYEGTVSFVHDLEVTSDNRDQMVGVDIHYQVCNDKLCLRPTTITKKIPLMSQN